MQAGCKPHLRSQEAACHLHDLVEGRLAWPVLITLSFVPPERSSFSYRDELSIECNAYRLMSLRAGALPLRCSAEYHLLGRKYMYPHPRDLQRLAAYQNLRGCHVKLERFSGEAVSDSIHC